MPERHDEHDALQQAIDESLRRTFAAPDPREILERARAEHARPIRVPWRRMLVAAAVLIAALGVSLWTWSIVRPTGGPEYAPMAWRAPETIWQDNVDAAMKPDWRCDTDAEFESFFYDHFGERLLITGDATTSLLGLSQVNCLTTRTMALLARAGDAPVLILIDRADQDGGIELPEDSPLELRRFHFGVYVIIVVGERDAEWTLGLRHALDDTDVTLIDSEDGG